MSFEITSISEIQNRIKCGEIFLLINEENFIFNCLSCNTSFAQINDYLSHTKSCLRDRCYKRSNDLNENFDKTYENLVEDAESIIKIEDMDAHEINIENELVSSPITLAIEIETVFSNTDEDLIEDSESVEALKNNQILRKLTNKGRKKRIITKKRDPHLFCNVCNKVFTTERTMKNHKKFCIDMPKNEDKNKNNKCHLCEAVLTRASNLEEHIRRHLGEKRHKCRFCDKRFVSKKEILVHERSHTGEKPYQCNECGQVFLTHGKLTVHIRRHTKDRPYKCELCDKSFYESHDLKDHMVVHSSDRPLSCDICNATFTRKKALISHKKIHSDITEYKCKICGKGFKQGPGLYSHMKSHGTLLNKP